MNAGPVQAVFNALGAPDIDVRFVGGCVRDAVLSRSIKDIDIATPDEPGVVVEKLSSAGLKVVPTGLAHGTVTAVVESQPFEITTLRKDTACDGRYAAVEFTTDWVEDASRRDFTFNAMSMRRNGELFDPFGGVADAEAGQVRFVGDPSDRIQEDYLRILRYFRFLALYGTQEPREDILTACRKHADGLAGLSRERVRDEVLKLLGAPAPAVSFNAMTRAGVLESLLPDVEVNGSLDRLLTSEHALTTHLSETDWCRRLVFLFSDDAVAIAQALKFSRKQAQRVADVRAAREAAADVEGPITRNRFLYAFANGLSDTVAIDGIAIACASADEEDVSSWKALIEAVKSWKPQRFPLAGADVQALGIAQGPDVGRLLKAVEQEWVDGGCMVSPDALRARLKVLAQ